MSRVSVDVTHSVNRTGKARASVPVMKAVLRRQRQITLLCSPEKPFCTFCLQSYSHICAFTSTTI